MNAQVSSSCLTNTELEALYRKDIAHMALVYMYETHASDTTLIDIPQPYIDSVKRAMAAVFNLNAQLEADSVMRRHCIRQDRHMEGFHLSGARNGVNLYVKVDPSKTWTDGWKSLNAATGYAALDELMAHCGFQVTGFNNTSGTANIKTAEIINAKAFADSLLKLDGILEVTFIPAVGDGNYIRYTYSNGAAHLLFRLGWGDCPMGCTGNKLWYYTVDGQCRVTLDSVRTIQAPGTYPIPSNCGITGLQDPQPGIRFSIYPNPTAGSLLLKTDGNKHYDYKLMDPHGRVLLRGKVNGTTTIALEAYARGMYLLQVSDPAGNRRSEKILLQ